MPLAVGQVIHNNRYRIVKLIGQGGFGAVYRAWDTSLNVAVAIKENLDTSPEAQKQFSSEAHILARLSHPHLPRVTDHFFIHSQGQYLVMDFVEGEDLQVILDRLGSLPEMQVLPWIEQVCDALTYLHSQNPPIIHRDLKPANIKIRPDGRAMLVDFGIAKVYDPNLSTTVGAKAVTPGFSPPEQYGQGKTDARSDVYALGATLYTLLTGQTPPESVQLVTGSATLLSPRQVKPQVMLQTEQAILRALEINTRRRFQSVIELRAALVGSFTPPVSLGPLPQTVKLPVSLARQSRMLLLLGVGLIVIVAALVGVAAGTFIQAQVTKTPVVAVTSSSIAITAKVTIASAPGILTATATISPTFTETPTDVLVTATITPSPTLTWTPTDTPVTPTTTPSLTPTNTPTDPPTPTPTDTPSPTPTWTPTSTPVPFPDLAWIAIPGGRFVMGSSEADIQSAVDDCNAYESNCQTDWFRAEGPQRTETIGDFEITRYEITNADYDLCVKNGPCSPPSKVSSDNSVTYVPSFFLDDYPVVTVRAVDASTFCQWVGGRLPSEREWEKAARGTDGRRYPWGNTLDLSLANLFSSGPTRVGSYSSGASPYGVMDIAGNVAEFTSDKVVRGGSWKNSPHQGRTTNRSTGSWLNHDFVNFDIGFRCVR